MEMYLLVTISNDTPPNIITKQLFGDSFPEAIRNELLKGESVAEWNVQNFESELDEMEYPQELRLQYIVDKIYNMIMFERNPKTSHQFVFWIENLTITKKDMCSWVPLTTKSKEKYDPTTS